MNKYRFFGAIAVIGILSTAFGAWLKILHRPKASLFLTIGLYGEGIGMAALIWFVFELLNKNNKNK